MNFEKFRRSKQTEFAISKDETKTETDNSSKDYEWINPETGQSEPLELTDDSGVELSDFRAKESQEITEALDNNQIVTVQCHSGFGISKFLIPRLQDILTKKGLTSAVYEIPVGDNWDVFKRDLFNGNRTQENFDESVIILDEFNDVDEIDLTLQHKLFGLILNHLRKGFDNKAIVLSYQAKEEIEKMLRNHQAPNIKCSDIKVRAKLFNSNQAIEYLQQYRGFTYKEASEAIKFAEKQRGLPLHFRVLFHGAFQLKEKSMGPIIGAYTNIRKK